MLTKLFSSLSAHLRRLKSNRFSFQIKIAAALGVMLLVTSATGLASSSSSTAQVNTPGSRLNCRVVPRGWVVQKLPHKAIVTQTGKTSGVWRQVSYAGTTCWAHSAYLAHTDKVDIQRLIALIGQQAAQKNSQRSVQKPTVSHKPTLNEKPTAKEKIEAKRVCAQTRTYDMLFVIPKSFRLPNGRTVGASQSHYNNSRELANHIENAYNTYSNGCIDINVTQLVSNTPVTEWQPKNGMPYFERYKRLFAPTLKNGKKWDLFAFTTPPDIVPSGAAGAQWGNGIWVESRPGAGYIADHELLHWVEHVVGTDSPSLPTCRKHPKSMVHCSPDWGYKVNSPAWFTDVFNTRVGGNKGMTRAMYDKLPL